MKNKILISINPVHVNNIIQGIKKYEYRKKLPKRNVSYLVIYETSPKMRIVAEVEILDILIESPEKLWDDTKEWSGIDKKFFDKYFNGRDFACAYKLGNVIVYKKPKQLKTLGIKAAPQSFIYL